MAGADELDDFKRNIDLREYAGACGYVLDRRESWAGSAVMRRGKSEKIIIKRNSNGHYVFFSVHDDTFNGTIIDFVQKQARGLSLGHVRRTLRAFAGRPALPACPSLPPLEKTGKDRAAVERAFLKMADAPAHPYLVHERRLPNALLAAERFAGRIKIDGHGNAVFPHFDEFGLCGFELKNTGFTGFAKGGKKGLWLSQATPTDHRLVLAESAINAISYASLFPDGQCRYGSIGGQVNPEQPALIGREVAALPAGGEVIAATDHDHAGAQLAEVIVAVVAAADRSDIACRIHRPEEPGADWNDIQKSRTASFPIAGVGGFAPVV
jgi:hypothetical protein